MPLVSFLSVATSVRYFGDHSAHLVSLVSLAESMSCFSDPSAHSASGVLGVCKCI